MNWKALLLVALVGFGLYQHRQQQPVDPGAGVVAPAAPVQGTTQSAGFQFKGYELQPLQDFVIDARVLASERYHSGRESGVPRAIQRIWLMVVLRLPSGLTTRQSLPWRCTVKHRSCPARIFFQVAQ